MCPESKWKIQTALSVEEKILGCAQKNFSRRLYSRIDADIMLAR